MLLLSVQRLTLKTVAWHNDEVACFCCCRKNCDATSGRTRPCNLPTNDTALLTLRWRHLYCRLKRRNWRILRRPTRTERRHPVYYRDGGQWKNSFSRLFGKPREQRTANDNVQNTDAYRQITWRMTGSNDYKDFGETSTTSLWQTGQPASRN